MSRPTIDLLILTALSAPSVSCDTALCLGMQWARSFSGSWHLICAGVYEQHVARSAGCYRIIDSG